MTWTNPVDLAEYYFPWEDGPAGAKPLDTADLDAMQQDLANLMIAIAQSLASYVDSNVASLTTQINALGGGTLVAPVNTEAPVISGTLSAGSILSCTQGQWDNAESYSYQWQKSLTEAGPFGDVFGNGATSASYTLQPDDANYYFQCVVTAGNGSLTASDGSNVLGPVIAATSVLHVQSTSGVTQVLTPQDTPFLAKFETVWGVNDTVTLNTDGGEFPNGFGAQAYTEMATTISQLLSKGVNGVRFRLSASYYNTLSVGAKTTYLTQVQAWATAVTNAGMYFMPCLWDGVDGSYSGAALTANYEQLGPLIAAVLGYIGTANPLVFWEPINEPNSLPGGWTDWQTIMEWVVATFRTAGYTGILVIGPPEYSNSGGESGEAALGYSDSYYSAIESADAAALGSAQHQIVFAKHDYANEYPSMTWSAAGWQAAVGGSQTKHAIFETEIGFENGASSTESAAWNVAALQTFASLQASMPNFCGVSGFLEAWTDDNSMTTLGTFTTLAPWGTDFKNYYLNPAQAAPPTPVSPPVIS